MSLPVAEIGLVQSATEISPNLWDLEVYTPKIAPLTKAGQFAHVRASDKFNPFLRRPLSIGPIAGDCLRLIFHIRGEGTRLLAEKKTGETVDLIGPLGNSISVDSDSTPLIFVTGGIGVVPLLLLDDQLPPETKRHFILGVRGRNTIPISLTEAERRNIKWTSDDGSLGFHGNAVQLLADIVAGFDTDTKPLIIGCGPGLMLQSMKRFAVQKGFPALASLEVPMGCGVGACQSCAVPRSDGKGYYLVCKDGPVFDCADVVLEPSVLP